MGERRGVHRILVRKPEGKRPLGSPRRGWEDNIRMNLYEVKCEGMYWIDLVLDRDRFVTDASFYPEYLFNRMPCYMHQHSLSNDHDSLATINSTCRGMNYTPRYVHVSIF
jgi:hypothetical protein